MSFESPVSAPTSERPTRPPRAGGVGLAGTALFVAASFAGAFLLFVVQPMTGKAVLPLLGGSPAVWNTCLFFFQAALLGGYLYAHAGIRLLGPRGMIPLHLAIALAAVLLLPAALPEGWTPPVDGSPAMAVLGVLTVAVGGPFLLLATTAPIVQRWYAAADSTGRRDPYFLYAASNLGSLGALLAYPFVLEPLLDLERQSRLWSVGFVVWIALIAGCAGLVVRVRARADADDAPADEAEEGRQGAEGTQGAQGTQGADGAQGAEDERDEGSGRGTFTAASDPAGPVTVRLRWLLLAALPSSLLLGVTTHLTTDVAAAPLLWVLPLALYLLSYAVTFSRRPVVAHGQALRWQPLLVIPLAVAWSWGIQIPTVTEVLLHLAVFFVTGLVCHGELVRLRPRADDLSGFYLWIAVGGAVGGLFNALVAPRLFVGAIEYPLALVGALVLRPGAHLVERGFRRNATDLLLALAVGGAALGGLWLEASVVTGTEGRVLIFLLMGAIAVACLRIAKRRTALALAVGALLLAGWGHRNAAVPVLRAERSFFGIHRVTLTEDGRFVRLFHGTTLHGAQSREPGRELEPLTYYRRGGPLDQTLEQVRRRSGPARVGVLGLGVGTMACLGTSGERWSFFEIDPAVIRIASDPSLFTFVSECPPSVEIVRGDARLSLDRREDRRFDLLVADAFSSDAIPVHLMTVEAIRVYLDRLAPDGILAFHVSNRHMDLEPVLAAVAQELELAAVAQLEEMPDEAEEEMIFGSHWVVFARRRAHLGGLATDGRWRPVREEASVSPWTDDHSDLLGVVEWEL